MVNSKYTLTLEKNCDDGWFVVAWKIIGKEGYYDNSHLEYVDAISCKTRQEAHVVSATALKDMGLES